MPRKQPERPFEILLVEDSPGDARLTLEAPAENGSRSRLHIVRDGVEACEFLHRRGKFADALRPDLILLDLNMPRMDGREFLKFVKGAGAFRHIPVVVLTTSTSPTDIWDAYGLHANCYLTKPVNLIDYVTLIRCVEEHWLDLAHLPQAAQGILTSPEDA